MEKFEEIECRLDEVKSDAASYSTIQMSLKKHGYITDKNYIIKHQYIRDNQDDFIQDWVDGILTKEELEEKYHCPYTTFIRYVRSLGIKRKKLKDRIDINSLVKDWESKQYYSYELCDKYNICESTLILYLRGQGIDDAGKRNGRKYYFNECYFDTIDNEHKAYWLGFIYADGSHNEERYSLRICLKKEDEELLKLFYKDIECNRELSYEYNKIYNKYYPFVSIQHPHLSQTLLQKGVLKNKSFKIKFPDDNIVPNNLLRHFIRGYFDGDGGITEPKIYYKISYSIAGNYNFLYELKEYVESQIDNYQLSLHKNSKSDIYTIVKGGTNMVQTFLDWLYKDSTIYMKRKHDKYLKLLEYNKEKNMENQKINIIKKLTKELNKASNDYYNIGNSKLSDQEFDLKLEELKKMEAETGIVMSNSPVNKVGYEVISSQNKITHVVPMLSLEKVHSSNEIIDFAKGNQLVAMFKMDGISLRATYDKNGNLIGLESRGNGSEGSDLFYQRYSFENIPLHIDVDTETIIDGEAIITDKDFKSINDSLTDENKYSHSRNLAAGSLALLDTRISAKRHLKMVVWDVIKSSEDFENSFSKKLNWAKEKGFDIVDYVIPTCSTTEKDIEKINEQLMNEAKEIGYGVDGVVWKFESIHHGNKMGRTEHHFCNAVAWKPKMEAQETILRDIVFDTSRTGMICPVAVFDEIDLDGALTTRATLHNLSYIKDLELGIGDTVQIIRSNMVIPKVIGNLTKSNTFTPPQMCPICGQPTEIRKDKDTEVLYCTNDNCRGKLLGKLSHFVSKNALNVDGLSEATLEKFINLGWLSNFKDIYSLKNYSTKMSSLDKFGAKSVTKLLKAIENSKNTTMERFLYSLSIPLIGRRASKDISVYCKSDINTFIDYMDKSYCFSNVLDGFGEAMNASLYKYWKEFRNEFLELLDIVKVKKIDNKHTKITGDLKTLDGKTFVITGKLVTYPNRDSLVEDIEQHGGKVASSVTAKIDYLINNDINSSSSKNKKARELNKPILSEDQLIQMIH